jgi:hypothetical protein
MFRTIGYYIIFFYVTVASVSAQQPSDTLMLSRQAIVFFGPTQAERDSLNLIKDSGIEEVLDDYLLYVGRIRNFIDSNKISTHETTARTFILLQQGRKPVRLSRKSIGSDVGFIFIKHGKKPKILKGVYTDLDLRLLISDYFGLKASIKPSDRH